MNTNLNPKTVALVIIDAQKGFDHPRWGNRNNPEAEDNIFKLSERARQAGATVLHVKHMSKRNTSPLHPTQPGNDFKPEATPLPGETVIEKEVNSAFIGTKLESILKGNDLRTVIVVGFVTVHCVSTTARMASNLGFETFVVSDATATFDRVDMYGVTIPAATMHRVALTELHGEFARVLTTNEMIHLLGQSRQ